MPNVQKHVSSATSTTSVFPRLSQLVPRPVAAQLLRYEQVTPRQYEGATICYVDLHQFLTTTSHLTPLQVSQLLSNVSRYTLTHAHTDTRTRTSLMEEFLCPKLLALRSGVGVRIFPPVNPFPRKRFTGHMTVKVFPPGKDFLGKIFPPGNLFPPLYRPFCTFLASISYGFGPGNSFPPAISKSLSPLGLSCTFGYLVLGFIIFDLLIEVEHRTEKCQDPCL